MPATEFSSRSLTAAKETSQQVLDAARERSRQMAGTAQRYIEENPVRAVSYTSALVFGLGLIVGRLLAPTRYDLEHAASAAKDLSREWHGTGARQSQQWLDTAKDKSQELLGTAQDRSRELLESAQTYVQEHPARTASYAAALLGLGVLFTLLLSSGKSSDTSS